LLRAVDSVALAGMISEFHHLSAIASVIVLVASTGCSVRESKNYELKTIEFSMGTGEFLPGANLKTVFQKKEAAEAAVEPISAGK
jgi:hypothetical protein